MSDLRRIDPLHSAKVADAFWCVPQVVAFIVDPVSCLFITQVLLQLVLGSSVGSVTQSEEMELQVWLTISYSPSVLGPTHYCSPALSFFTQCPTSQLKGAFPGDVRTCEESEPFPPWPFHGVGWVGLREKRCRWTKVRCLEPQSWGASS